MATLKAMFKLFDGYSTTIDKIDRKTNQATDKIMKASGATDGFNKKLDATGASASRASSGLRKLIGTVISLAAVKKGMDLTDTYINTNARLNLINDGLQTQVELQDKIFAAADRSRGSYAEMADAVAKMGLLAGDAFGSNDETIAFTELVQKSFKLGGAETSEQQGAMRQLTQAMASGRLQGDEFVSISENAPMILEAISKYTGLSRGELKKLSSEGAITADMIKGSMFAMGEEIEDMFADMPMTFGDVWNKIANGATSAFRPVMESINGLINTDGFQSTINMLITGIDMLAMGIIWVFDIFTSNWDIVGPILGAIATYYLIIIITNLWAMVAPMVVNLGLWTMLSSPIFLVALYIGLVISVLNDMGVTVEMVFGFIGGSIAVLLTLFLNLGNAITNAFIGIAKIIDSVITAAVNLVLSGVNKIIAALNEIPGVKISSVGEFGGYMSGIDYLKYGNVGDAYKAGSDMGKNVYGGISDKIGSFKNKISMPESSFNTPNMAGTGIPNMPGMPGKGGGANKPIKVKGTGKNDKVEVAMDDADLKYLRDIAERDFINKFSTATLAPNIQVTFGDIHEEADANKVAGRIKLILQEEIATVAEGDY